MRTNLEFLLVCEATIDTQCTHGQWRFVLEEIDGSPFLEASDIEDGDANRLSLWALLRGLEALPGPSAVTMLTSSRYVIRSLSDSLPRWRDANFHWEHFGQVLPITNADLWRRVDNALGIHQVSACCVAPAMGPRTALAPLREIVARPSECGNSLRAERLTSVTDTLRRWLIAQCGVIARGTPAAGGTTMAVA